MTSQWKHLTPEVVTRVHFWSLSLLTYMSNAVVTNLKKIWQIKGVSLHGWKLNQNTILIPIPHPNIQLRHVCFIVMLRLLIYWLHVLFVLQEVSPEVDEHGNLLPPSDNCDLKRPPTQQKPFMNPKQETTEEVFEKIKSMWHFGNKWLGNTYISQAPKQ